MLELRDGMAIFVFRLGPNTSLCDRAQLPGTELAPFPDPFPYNRRARKSRALPDKGPGLSSASMRDPARNRKGSRRTAACA